MGIIFYLERTTDASLPYEGLGVYIDELIQGTAGVFILFFGPSGTKYQGCTNVYPPRLEARGRAPQPVAVVVTVRRRGGT